MQSKKLEDFSRRNPAIAPLVVKLRQYIRWLSEQGIREVLPRVAAAQLGISEGDTLGLLGLFETAGLLKSRYDLICVPTRAVLASFDTFKHVPDEYECALCGRGHDADDLRIELAFAIDEGRAADAAA